MAVTLAWPAEFRFVDANGGPVTVSGVSLTTGIEIFEAGTSTQKNSYPTQADAEAGTNANPNPLAITDGLPENQVWVDGLFKTVVKYASVTITTDNRGDASDVSTFARGFISGLVLSNDTDTAHDINVTAGKARDDADSEDLVLTSEITKQIDALWAVGDNAGGLDTGTVANSTWYYLWLIKRVDTGVVDVLFSASSSAPTLPTNYTKKRLIGAVKTDGSANIIGFTAFELSGGGLQYLWDDPPLDIDISNLGATSADQVLASIPTGFSYDALLNVGVSNASTTSSVYLRNKAVNDEAASSTAAPLATIRATATGSVHTVKVTVRTDTSATIAARSTDASTTLKIAVLGWIDER